MCLHLCHCVRDGVGNVDFVAWIHECVIEAHRPIRSLLLGVQIVDFLLICGHFIRDIVATVLDPATFALLQVSIHLSRPNRWLHTVMEQTVTLGEVDDVDVDSLHELAVVLHAEVEPL